MDIYDFMKRLFLFFFLILLLTLIGCKNQNETVEGSICNLPYYEYKKGDCCLDQNLNQVCDKDESDGKFEEGLESSKDKTINEAMGSVFKITTGPDDKIIGGAFLISPEGYVLTSNHVIEEFYEDDFKDITLHDKYKNKYNELELAGYSYNYDLALLKIKENKTFPYLEFEDFNEARVGNKVFSLGNHDDLDFSVSSGIISAKDREGYFNPDLKDYLQTDAAINVGNTGGPLINEKGKVVGMSSYGYDSRYSEGLYFALQSNKMEELYENMRYASEHLFLKKGPSFYQTKPNKSAIEASSYENFEIVYGEDKTIEGGTKKSHVLDEYRYYYSFFDNFKIKLSNVDNVTHNICFDILIMKEGIKNVKKKLKIIITIEPEENKMETIPVAIRDNGGRDSYFEIETFDCDSGESYHKAIERHYGPLK